MSQPAFQAWASAGFGAELVQVCLPGCPICCDKGSPGGKASHFARWQQRAITPSDLARWARQGGNVGLRTRSFPALDLDVEEPELADACERVALLTLGSTARRTRANSARRLLLFRLEGAPFRKAVISFTTPAGEKAKIEILAEGQQVVVGGVHHTGAAIEWRAGQPTAAALAPMTLELRDGVLGALRRRLAALGCALDAAPGSARRAPHRRPPHERYAGQDAELAEMALRRLNPDAAYEDWVNVGMALHAKWPEPNGAGFALWDAWSARGQKYAGTRDTERHWASFRSGGGIGFGTLVVMARRAG